jgi:geranylgeranyl pyrophosphate synthase
MIGFFSHAIDFFLPELDFMVMNQQYTTRLESIEKVLETSLPEIVSKDWIYTVAAGQGTGVDLSYYENIHKPALDLLKRGGKRWRPMLMLLAAELHGKSDLALQLTPLVELPHNGSLIIDDIEDKSDMRRGKPAVHLLYGEDMSINSGNYLYVVPSYLLDELEMSNETRVNLYSCFLTNLRRLHFGQGLDIQWHRDHRSVPEVDEYLQMCRFKTGCLARMAAELGVLSTGGKLQDAEDIGKVCESMGVGFQIIDDVRNLETGNPGKKRGDDIVEGKKSLPVILFYQDPENDIKTLQACFKEAGELGEEKGRASIEKAIQLMEDAGVIREARKIAESMLDEAVGILQDRYPGHEAAVLLEEMITGFAK